MSILPGNASSAVFNGTAGDIDFAADRNAFDVATNMDFYVFNPSSEASGDATNTLGRITWNYVLPFEVVTANSGSVSIRAWDIDPSDDVQVFFDLGEGNRYYAGNITGSNGGNVATWEGAVAGGTTADLSGWSTTTFNLPAAALAGISGSSLFSLTMDVRQEADGWAAVIDYATLNLDYDAGRPNPSTAVPEPGTMMLLGSGLAGLAAWRRRK